MRDEMLVFSMLCPRNVPFELFCKTLVRVGCGEGLIDPSWARGSAAFEIFEEMDGDDLQRELSLIRYWQDEGYDFIIPTDPDYPREFFYMDDPPTLLFFWGARACLCLPKLAVVGSREPSPVSVSWVEQEVGRFLETQPTCIVSGGARGIDQAAHRIAIRKRIPTLVFLPSGFDRLYPENLQNWQKSVWDCGGAFVSEYPPPIFVQRAHFVQRNRLIAGISAATLLVEARVKSGTLLTARSAIEQGRPVYVMPTHPYDTNGRGGLDMIADGAVLVRDAQELSDFFGAEIKTRDIVGICGAAERCSPGTSSSRLEQMELNI